MAQYIKLYISFFFYFNSPLYSSCLNAKILPPKDHDVSSQMPNSRAENESRHWAAVASYMQTGSVEFLTFFREDLPPYIPKDYLTWTLRIHLWSPFFHFIFQLLDLGYYDSCSTHEMRNGWWISTECDKKRSLLEKIWLILPLIVAYISLQK